MFKDDYPWIYEAGRDVISIMKTESDMETKLSALDDFKDFIENTVENPILRRYHLHDERAYMMIKELPYLFKSVIYNDTSKINFNITP